MNDTNTAQHYTYKHGEDDIHYFEYLDETKKSVDQMVNKLREVYATLPPNPKNVKLHVDLSVTRNGPPIRAFAEKFQPFLREFPDRPAASLAIIMQRGSVLTMLSTFLNLFGRSKDRFKMFNEEEKQEAVTWLLEADK